MNGSTASASNNTGARDLVISVNWIGDAIMAMPALQLYRRLRPDNRITVLARGAVADVWKLNAAPDEVMAYDGRPGLFHPLYASLRASSFDSAWILPNSFRSALLAFRAGIPVRRGVPGGFRSLLLTERIHREVRGDRKHQAWESIYMMNPSARLTEIPEPRIAIPADTVAAAKEKLGGADGSMIGLIPGAARGPSKRWPEAHYLALAKRFVREGHTVLLFGGPDDRELCSRMCEGAGGIINLAGRTTVTEWAAMMSLCSMIVANDSGGMHLAAALGIPLIALYGMTDPERTGPIGRRCVIMQKSKTRSRDIPRNSSEAIESLAAIRPGEVYEASRSFTLSSGAEGGRS